MSVPIKKRPTKKGTFLKMKYKGAFYLIPKKVADKYKVDLPVNKVSRVKSDSILADDLFDELDKKFTKPGILLQGLRHREGLSQVAFAKKINVTQSDLSKMEHGKRPIGKLIAKRIAHQFGVDYRLFLG